MGLDVVALGAALSYTDKEVSTLKTMNRFLSFWDCTTGLPVTDPQSSPYTYKTGDYYRVSNVAALGGTNYKPNGSTYTKGVASTTVESGTVQEGYIYFYDGTNWTAQETWGPVNDVRVGGTSVVTGGIANIPTIHTEDTISAASWSSYTGNADRVYLYED